MAEPSFPAGPTGSGLARTLRSHAIEAEMRQSYMDYAMSVIIGRALPDVRDGLKPSQRRVLYAMFREKLLPTRSHSKCAGIVGEVLKKYHPHGDASVYDTLVRLAQGFNLRHPLIQGKGNFGSVDGDPAAAYRYTEARLTPFSVAMMADIDRDTVDYTPNFDGKTEEPVALPTVIPNLLVNGSDGIAVGMATKIPPHNLDEVTAALVHLIEHPDQDEEDLQRRLLELVPGPDFPTGGRIYGRQGIVRAYQTGRGVIQIRAVTDFETTGKGRQRIVVTEIPYQVNKARLVEKIADLVKDKRVTGIADLRDESDRRGMRIVVDLKRGEEPQVVLNNLYRHTPLQQSFGLNLLAIARARPKLFSLVEMLREFLQFRREVVRRRAEFDLKGAEARMHILEGLAAAVDRLDEVIEWIRTSPDPATAKARLLERLEPAGFRVDRTLLERSGAVGDGRLSEKQAQAILDMRLQRLTRLEQDRIEGEMGEIGARIGDLLDLLGNPERIDAIIRDEALAAARQHANERRTGIVEAASDLTIEELIPVEDIVISLTQAGYVKRTPLSDYRAQARGGTGHAGVGIRSGDAIRALLIGNTHRGVLFITDDGWAYRLKGYELPEAGKAGTGRPVVNLLHLPRDRRVVAVVPLPAEDQAPDELHLVTATRQGKVKRTPYHQYRNARKHGIRAVRVPEGDALVGAELTSGRAEVMLATRDGKAIRFSEEGAPPKGRVAMGVKGITLDPGDEVVSLVVVEDPVEHPGLLMTITRHGYGKVSALDRYRPQGRAGKGLINIATSKRNGPAVAAAFVRFGEEVIVITAGGKAVRVPIDENLRDMGRYAQGVRVMRVRDGDEVVAMTRVGVPAAEGDPDENGAGISETA